MLVNMVGTAPIPENEGERLAALHSYELLDTPPDERFDLFTRLGTWLFQVPMSAINLVDADRTFFKSLVGLPAYEPSRCTSICAHAVGGSDDLMVIEDLTRDVRFSDHPLAVQGIRFYAGALLRSNTGFTLGTLCIVDVKPRQFSTDDRQKLRELANGVSAVLELHRRGLMLVRAASQDTLTGLYTRRAFDEKLEVAVANATSQTKYALLYLDLDRFKTVNNKFGHAGGDALLREVGRRITQTTRAGDVAARLGGDEFVVLMSEMASAAAAEQMASNLIAAFAVPFAIDGEDVRIRCSIGIALYPANAFNRDDLLRCADLALFKAKRSGRGRYRLYRQDEFAGPVTANCA